MLSVATAIMADDLAVATSGWVGLGRVGWGWVGLV